MIKQYAISITTTAAAALGLCSAASAHVTLPAGGATAGAQYDAVFHVQHACKGTPSTSGITVRIPNGFTVLSAEPRTGWTLTTVANRVSWRSDSQTASLPTSEAADFIIHGKLTDKPQTLYFKVLQTCDSVNVDWANTSGAASETAEFPAPKLEVLAHGIAPVEIRDAWVRATTPGQFSSGLFMKLTAPSGARLVGLSTPAAGIAEVHEMKMEGDVMRMRPVEGGLDLPPRQTIELKSGGYHVMLMDLKKPLSIGDSIEFDLQFVDRQGKHCTSHLNVKVQGGPPASLMDGAMHHR